LKPKKKRIAGQNVIPCVVEPAFGIGRIVYCILEQNFYQRQGDEQKAVLSLKPIIAPTVTTILPLISKDSLISKVYEIEKLLKKFRISSKVDCIGATIGKRYARTDELGIPYGLTVDFTTLEDQTITLRERDTTEQIRIPISSIAQVLLELIHEETTWEKLKNSYPLVVQKDEK